MRIDAFRPENEFLHSMDTWINRFKNASRIQEDMPVEIPGDQERKAEAERRLQGIPLHEKVIEDLQSIAQRLDLEFPVAIKS
jgi:LDH2 family malate/lactate/ureidoglycolate dehydrogenase